MERKHTKTRLTVRPIRFADGAAIHALACDPALAWTSRIPHPLPPGEGERFAERAANAWESATWFTFVVVEGEELRGLSLVEPQGRHAYLSYWTGKPFWNRGVATMAARAAIGFAFAQLDCAELRAMVLRGNAASHRVLRANGFSIAPALATERQAGDRFAYPSAVAYRLVRTEGARGEIAMTLQQLLDGYAEIYRMPAIVLDDNGMCRLSFRETINVDIEPARRPGHVHLYTSLARIPANADAAWFMALQQANLFGRDTGFAATACNTETNEVLLCQLLDLEGITAERFDLLLQDFVHSAEALSERLRNAAPQKSLEVETMHMIRV